MRAQVGVRDHDTVVRHRTCRAEGQARLKWMRLSELGKLVTWHPVIDSAIYENGPYVAPPRTIAWPPGMESMPNEGERVLVKLSSALTNQPWEEPWLATIDMDGNQLLSFACDYDPGTTDIVTHWAYLPV